MAGANAQRSQPLPLLLFVGTIFLAASVAGADSYTDCGTTCSCGPSKAACQTGPAKTNCCFSDGSCKKVASLSYLTDTRNCGACGKVCPGSTPSCCNGVCRSKRSFHADRLNCGFCGNRCFDYELCCGTCVLRDNENCGSCGNSCRHGTTCCGNKCVLLKSAFQSDAKNCGSCGNKCKSGKSCCNGVCAHASSFLKDANNCGKCNLKCGRGKTCCNGVCKCSGDYKSDVKNCGSCGNKCGTDKPSCVQGVCKSPHY